MDFAEAIRGIFGGQSPQSPPSGDDYAAPLRPMVDAGAEVRRKPRLSFDLYPPKSDHDPVLGEELHDILRSKDKVPSPDFIAPPPGLGQAPNRVPSDMQYERPPNVLSENAARGISAGAVEPFGQAGRLATGGSEDVAGDLAGVGAAVAPIPGAGIGKAIGKAAKAGIEGAEHATTGGVADMIKAYHGSPHDFDRFDLSKIGTGEGAQAYGHGLYFAENEGVAKGYRDTLARNKFTYDGKPASETWEASSLDYLDPRVVSEHGPKTAIEEAIPRLKKQAQFHSDTYEGGQGRPNLYDNAAARLERLDPEKVKSTGKMYQVGIRANPEHFLDWDKPLSEQPEKIQDALLGARYKGDKEAVASVKKNDDFMSRSVQSHMYDLQHEKILGSPEKATTALREAGIPGIKYLDQGSRGKGDGTRNYVVFDDKLIDILKKYGIAGIGALPAMNAFHYQDKQ